MSLTEYLMEVLKIAPSEIIENEPAFQLNLLTYMEVDSD